MPPSPLHFSAIAPLYFKWPKSFDITALLFSSTLVDLELLVFLLNGEPMIHGFWHSYLFVLTIYPAALSPILYLLERGIDKKIEGIYRFFRFFPETISYPLKAIYISCLVGGASHIFLDMWVHQNSSWVLFPFYEGNLFWIGEWSIIVFGLVTLLSLYAVFLWIRQMRIPRRNSTQS